MTPGQVLGIARDVVLLVAVGFVLWYVTHAEHNADELKSIKATLGQTQKWQEGQEHAAKTAGESLAALNGRLDSLDQRGPVIVRVPVPAGVVTAPGASGAPANTCPSAPGAGGGVRSVDIRPVLEGPERRIATAMIECQQALDAWPK